VKASSGRKSRRIAALAGSSNCSPTFGRASSPPSGGDHGSMASAQDGRVRRVCRDRGGRGGLCHISEAGEDAATKLEPAWARLQDHQDQLEERRLPEPARHLRATKPAAARWKAYKKESHKAPVSSSTYYWRRSSNLRKSGRSDKERKERAVRRFSQARQQRPPERVADCVRGSA